MEGEEETRPTAMRLQKQKRGEGRCVSQGRTTKDEETAERRERGGGGARLVHYEREEGESESRSVEPKGKNLV
jgi:hypothetical protein